MSWAGLGAGTVVALSALPWPLNARGRYSVPKTPKPKPFGMVSSGQSFSHSTNISYVPGDHMSPQFSPHYSRGSGE